MVFDVVRSRAGDRDLDLLFDHLVEVHQALGDPLAEAFERAAARVRAVEADMERLGHAPRQGTLREDLRPGLRQVTRNRVVFYFELDEDREELRVLAVFFGSTTRVGSEWRAGPFPELAKTTAAPHMDAKEPCRQCVRHPAGIRAMGFA